MNSSVKSFVPSVSVLLDPAPLLAAVVLELLAAGVEVELEFDLLLPHAASSSATISDSATATIGADGLRLIEPLDMSSSFCGCHPPARSGPSPCTTVLRPRPRSGRGVTAN